MKLLFQMLVVVLWIVSSCFLAGGSLSFREGLNDLGTMFPQEARFIPPPCSSAYRLLCELILLGRVRCLGECNNGFSRVATSLSRVATCSSTRERASAACFSLMSSSRRRLLVSSSLLVRMAVFSRRRFSLSCMLMLGRLRRSSTLGRCVSWCYRHQLMTLELEGRVPLEFRGVAVGQADLTSLGLETRPFLKETGVLLSLGPVSHAGHVVEELAYAVDLALFGVGASESLLGTLVVGLLDYVLGLGQTVTLLHLLGHPEVTQLHVQVSVQEDVRWLDVPVQNGLAVLPPVDLIEGQGELLKHPPDEVFRETVLALLPLLQEGGQVSPGTVLHQNVEFLLLLVHHPVYVADDVSVAALPQQVHLRHDLLLPVGRNVSVVQFLHHDGLLRCPWTRPVLSPVHLALLSHPDQLRELYPIHQLYYYIMQPLELLSPTYTRLLPSHFPRFYNRHVALLGRIKDLSERQVIVQLDEDRLIYGDIDSPLLRTLLPLRGEAFVEFRGVLVNQNLLKVEGANAFPETPGQPKEVMQVYRAMVELQHSPAYRELF